MIFFNYLIACPHNNYREGWQSFVSKGYVLGGVCAIATHLTKFTESIFNTAY